MIQRERVEQDDGGAVALHGIEDVCVVAPEPHVRILRRRRWRIYRVRCRRRVVHAVGLIGHEDPCDQVRDKAAATEESDNQPQHANQGYVEIEVLGEARADARNFPSRLWTDEPTTTLYRTDPLAAIGAKISVILNDFAAVVAIHIVPPYRIDTRGGRERFQIDGSYSNHQVSLNPTDVCSRQTGTLFGLLGKFDFPSFGSD